ncbi:MAG: hypothetical protein RBS57_15200, partial [Desulforhabdus sp.]|nr:hypothetical protein [Desulforhabdus sp.]
MLKRGFFLTFFFLTVLIVQPTFVHCGVEQSESKVFRTGKLKPVDSRTHLKIGDKAPDFTLPSIGG